MTPSLISIIRSPAAIFAGIAVNVVLSLALDGIFQGLGVLPAAGQPMSDYLHLLPFSYRVGIALFGFYVTARLAPSRPLLHALTLAAIAFALTLASTVAAWSKLGAVEPQWLQLAMLTLLFPMAWLGLRLAKCSTNPAPANQSGALAV